jgi:hypothetical protein
MENPYEYGSYPRLFQVFVKIVGGKETLALDMRPDDTIDVLRRLIKAAIGLRAADQSLRWKNEILGVAENSMAYDDTQTLESYGIEHRSTVYCGCRGGDSLRQYIPESERKKRKLESLLDREDVFAHARQGRDSARQERDSARRERDGARRERDAAQNERDGACGERDAARDELASAVATARQEEGDAAQERLSSAVAAARDEEARRSNKCTHIDVASLRTMPDSEFEALQAAVNAAQPLIQAEQQRRLERGREAQLCIICMSEPKAYAPRQCGHLSYCAGCLPSRDAASRCPICRANVPPGDWMRIFA